MTHLKRLASCLLAILLVITLIPGGELTTAHAAQATLTPDAVVNPADNVTLSKTAVQTAIDEWEVTLQISGGGSTTVKPQIDIVLVTDYSSVCWDVYYQGKPVLFYQFDLEQYNETQGSYIDMETELFGDRATEPEQLFALLEDAAANGFQLKEKYAEMRESMYAYLDHHNSQRTCEEIQKRNW